MIEMLVDMDFFRLKMQNFSLVWEERFKLFGCVKNSRPNLIRKS